MLQPIYFEISVPHNFSESLEDDPKQNGTVNCLQNCLANKSMNC